MMKSMRDELNANRLHDFYKAWENHKRLGFAATQEEANRIAESLGIDPAPKLDTAPKQQAVTSGSARPTPRRTVYIQFSNLEESPVVVAYTAAKAAIRSYFEMLVHVNFITHEIQDPGAPFPAERIDELAKEAERWGSEIFPNLGVSVSIDEKRL